MNLSKINMQPNWSSYVPRSFHTRGSPRDRNLGTCPLEAFSNEGYLSGTCKDQKRIVTAGPNVGLHTDHGKEYLSEA